MGKIKDTHGNCCKFCNIRQQQDYEACVECFSEFIHPLEDGHCPKCLDPRPEEKQSYPQCYTCYNNLERDKYYLDGVISCGYEFGDMDFGFALHGYKNAGINAPWMIFPLICLTTLFLNKHISCIEEEYCCDLDAIVPTPGHAENLLVHDRYANINVLNCLCDNRDPSHRQSAGYIHEFNSNRFTVEGDAPNSILLFDDTLTRGSTSNSAAYALKQSGAQNVILITLGKHLDRSAAYLTDYTTNFDIEKCFFCK